LIRAVLPSFRAESPRWPRTAKQSVVATPSGMYSL
jgi:hypothetical protein